MPDIEGVPYEATGGPVNQSTAERLATLGREWASAGVAAASAAGASALSSAKAYTDQKVTGFATTVAMNAADALTLSNAKTYTDAQLAGFSGNGIETVFGTVTLDATGAPIREVYAASAATVQGESLAVGEMALFRYFAGAWQVIVFDDTGAPRDAVWRMPGSNPGTGDAVPPVGGVLTVTGAGTSRTLTVTGAKDADSGLHAVPYSFSRDNGASWTAWQALNTYTFTDVPVGIHAPRARVRDAAGIPNIAIITAPSFTVEPPTVPIVDNFNRFSTADVDLVGTTTSDSNGTWLTDLPLAANKGPVSSLRSDGSGRIKIESSRGAALKLTKPTARLAVDFNTTTSQFRLAIGASTASRVALWVNSGKYTIHSGSTVLGAADVPDPLGRTAGRVSLEWDGATATVRVDNDVIMARPAPALSVPATHAALAGMAGSGGWFDNVEVTYL